ncbi:MAG: hypothetical protein L0226_07705 [Acidobacteria bacterium]|nr:hypothetical protein [Acidobacteriota bacterium]MCI0662328.1 hypothetical protein [Acidobacteriota bacterium]
MKVPSDVQKVVKALPEDKRKKVEAIVRRHIDACHRMGVDVEYLDRVWIEAIESVEIEEKFPELVETQQWPDAEPARRYEVYEPPRAEW